MGPVCFKYTQQSSWYLPKNEQIKLIPKALLLKSSDLCHRYFPFIYLNIYFEKSVVQIKSLWAWMVRVWEELTQFCFSNSLQQVILSLYILVLLPLKQEYWKFCPSEGCSECKLRPAGWKACRAFIYICVTASSFQHTGLQSIIRGMWSKQHCSALHASIFVHSNKKSTWILAELQNWQAGLA